MRPRLGTTAGLAGSQENFTKIDKECVDISTSIRLRRSSRPFVRSAKVCCECREGCKDRQGPAPDLCFRTCMPFISRWLGFISLPLQVAGANPQTSAFYLRSKGLTEQALAELGYKDTIIFRPMLLSNVQRPEKRLGETLAMYVPLPDLFRLQSV